MILEVTSLIVTKTSRCSWREQSQITMIKRTRISKRMAERDSMDKTLFLKISKQIFSQQRELKLCLKSLLRRYNQLHSNQEIKSLSTQLHNNISNIRKDKVKQLVLVLALVLEEISLLLEAASKRQNDMHINH